MQISICDHCKKEMFPSSAIEVFLVEYTETKARESAIDLCAECRDKFYLWLSGDCDENTTQTN